MSFYILYYFTHVSLLHQLMNIHVYKLLYSLSDVATHD